MEIIGADTLAQNFLDKWSSGAEWFEAHTSGSTGTPKEILLPRKDMLTSAKATCKYFNLNSKSTIVSPLSASYIAGKMMIVRAIAADCRLIMETPSNEPLKSAYGDIDLLPIVPSQAEWILNGNARGNILKNVIIGGGPASPALERRLSEAPFKCHATYGMTETCSHIALRQIGNPNYEAMPGIEFGQDSERRLVIYADGYSFGSLTTNDIVELIDRRHFRWLGRKDNVIISGGIKLHPEEIERELSELIEQPFYLIGEPDEKWGTAMIMYVECQPTEIDTEELKRKIKNRIHRHKVPQAIRLRQQFKRTSSGKIKRVLL